MQQNNASHWLTTVVACAMLWSGPAFAAAQRIEAQNFVIEYQDISEQTARLVAEDAVQAFAEITSFLKRNYTGRIRIRIGDAFPFPRSTAADATMEIPANRLRPGGARRGPPPIRGRGATIWNGLSNIIAESAHPVTGWGRFLKEGLGIFLQEKFGAKKPRPWPAKVYPAMGEDLHQAAARLSSDYGRFLTLEEARTRVNRRRLDRTRRLAWIEAGSFVRYLIENRGGVERFLKWYDGRPFEDVYGKDIGAIETEWVSFVKKLRS